MFKFLFIFFFSFLSINCTYLIPKDFGERIIYYPGQAHIKAEIDLTLEIFADNLQNVLKNSKLTSFDTIAVRECSTPEYIKSRLHELNIFWVEKNFNCYYNGVLIKCLGTSYKGELRVVWKGIISDTALVHELQHWIDEICNVPIDWHHERKDWWDVEYKVNRILKKHGL